MCERILNSHWIRKNIRSYGITALEIIVSLVLVVAMVSLYFMHAAATGPTAADSRIQGWVSQLGDEQLTPARHLAQQQLEQAGEASVDPLIAALHAPDSALRRNSAEMLGFIASPHALEALAAAMANDPVPTVRSHAAWALGELYDLNAVTPLEEASVLDQDPDVRQEASRSLDALRAHLALIAGKNEQITSAYAIAPGRPDVVYLSVMNQVSISRDGGRTWSLTGGNLPSRVSALAVSPVNPEIVYAGTESLGLFESTDGGTTWRPRNQGLGLNLGVRLTVTAIAIDTQSPNRIYAATGAWVGGGQMALTPMGVRVSLDAGNSWQGLALPAERTGVTRLLVFGNELYASAGNEVSSLPI